MPSKQGEPSPQLPPRLVDAHKGSGGRLLILGGSLGMSGAPRWVAEAADRVGVGLITLAVPASIAGVVAGARPECLCLSLAATATGKCSFAALGGLLPAQERATAFVVGPGLGRSTDLSHLVLRLIRAPGPPTVVDADALLPELLSREASPSRPLVMTPHPGEAGLLLGVTAGEIQRDRRSAVLRISERAGGIAILKGARTLVAHEGTIYENDTGNPGLARGGTGDLLAGVLGGLLAQGFGVLKAAQFAVQLHGAASDRLRPRLGERAQTLRSILRGLVLEVRDAEKRGLTAEGRPATDRPA